MLFLDDVDIVHGRNLRRVVNQPHKLPGNPLVVPEYPWEVGGVYFYGSVIHDQGKFRMWYMAIGREYREQRTAYAESEDGIHYEKKLNPHWPLDNQPASNIVLGRHVNTCGPAVLKDEETADPSARFKLFFDSYLNLHKNLEVPERLIPGPLTSSSKVTEDDWRPPYHRGQFVSFSPDGIRWWPEDGYLVRIGQSDIGQCVLWDPKARLFRAYIRENEIGTRGRRIRLVHTMTSRDFLNWTPSHEVFRPDALDGPPDTQIYGISVTFHHNLFIGIIQVFEIEELCPNPNNPNLPYERGKFHAQLVVSRDGEHFTRVGDRQPFLETGEEGSWEGGMVRVGSRFLVHDDVMWFYYDGRNAHHHHREETDGSLITGIGGAILPLDRFVALVPNEPDKPAEVVVSLDPDGAWPPMLNVEMEGSGRVLFALCNERGEELEGFEERNCIPLVEGGLRCPLRWKESGCQRPTPSLGCPQLRLRFQHAKLYAVYI